MKQSSRTIVVFLAFLVVYPISALAGATDVPPQAIKAAQDFLDYSKEGAKEDPNWFKDKWKVDVKNTESLELGTPVQLYGVSKENLTKVVDNGDIFVLSELRGFAFPVFSETEFVGVIRVLERDGEWHFSGRNFSTDPMYRNALVLQNNYHGESGYKIAALSARHVGVYILVIQKGIPKYAMPAMEGPPGQFSIQETSVDQLPLVEYDNLKATIKDQAERSKQNKVEQ